jgi:SAM-dependent methyltransferase
MNLPRRLQPEWLDRLPADDPRAIRTRRDLLRINVCMLNVQIMSPAVLRHAVGRPRTIVDLGSGDGQFILRVARRVAPHWPNVTVILQDRQDLVTRAARQDFAALQWRVETSVTDVFDFLETTQFACVDVITSNLFLHHFTDMQLARLFGKASQSARLLVACEPLRAKFVVNASQLLWMIGCSKASVHDAVVSAHAGFRDNELSALWPSGRQWELQEHRAGLFTHCFAAVSGQNRR